ncbi:MAG: hypothetical protein IKW90_00230 [Lachnospiraceae bacterium]|nr:hypothetical protein [Lachnospiraceae bacterium]
MIRFNTTNYGSLFGYSGSSSSNYTNTLYSNLSQLSSVKSGAYSKALKALYSKNSDTSTSSVLKNSNIKYTVDSELSGVKRESGELAEAAKKLSSTGKNDLFANKDKYDSDAAYKAVSDLVSNYNETVSAADKAGNSAIDNAVSSMARMTGIMGKSLSKAGITVGVDGKMSVDEEAFKKADMNTVKDLFGNNGYFGKSIASSAQRIESIAGQQELKNSGNQNFYGKNGSYYGIYDTGYLFDGLF